MDTRENSDVAQIGQAPLKRAAILTQEKSRIVETMYDEAARKRIAQLFDLHAEVVTMRDLEDGLVDVAGFHALFGTWGFPVLDEKQVARFESLEHIFYGAGSIKYFGLPFLQAGVTISSSKSTNGRVVAAFCLGQILLASKRYFQNVACYNSNEIGRTLHARRPSFSGCNGSKIGLIGCGSVTRHLIGSLRKRGFSIQVVDPFLSDEESRSLGVSKRTLEAVFRECDVVSNQLPNLPHLRGILEKRHFESMKSEATFMNTGRGAQVNEDDLAEVFAARPDLVALLDVTDPEPPEARSKLYELSNVLLSSHIAGCVGEEVRLLIDEAIDTAEKWLRGEALPNLESLESFDLKA